MLNESIPLTPTDLTLDTKQTLATAFKWSTRTVDNYMAQGMPHLKLSPRCVRFDRADVIAWLKRTFSTRRIVTRG